MSSTPPDAPAQSVEVLLRLVPFFRALDRLDSARLVGALEQVSLPAGSLIFSEDTAPDALYLLAHGQVEVTVKTAGGERPVAALEAPAYFGELGLILPRRTAAVRAVTDIDVWKLPRHRFNQVARDRPAVGLAMATALAQLLDQRSRQHAGAPAAPSTIQTAALAAETKIGAPQRSARRWAAAALSVAVPAALWAVTPPPGLTMQGWHVLLPVLGAAIAWLFQTAPDFVIALALAAAWGLTGGAPLPAVFSGFASSTWVLMLGVIGVSVAMSRSGLLFRLMLLFLKKFPRTPAGQVVAMMAGGVVATPLVSSTTSRLAMTASLAHELAQSQDYPARSRASAALAFASLIGYSTFSSIFLTGLPTNFYLLGLMPAPDRARADWLWWLAASAPAGAVIFAGALAVLLLFYRSAQARRISDEVLWRQERALGPLSRHEVITLAALAVALTGLVFQQALRIDAAWFGVAALVIVLAAGVLDRAAFRSSIDWGFIVMFGVLIGSGEVFHRAGLDRWIAGGLVPLARAVGNPGLFVVVLAVLVAASRLVLPRLPSNFLLVLALVPAAPSLGLAPWLAGFVVLTVGNVWILPGLSDYYALVKETTKGEMFTDRDGLVVGVLITLLVLIGIAVSVPYWRAMGLIGR